LEAGIGRPESTFTRPWRQLIGRFTQNCCI
jgi:hypothetical protein